MRGRGKGEGGGEGEGGGSGSWGKWCIWSRLEWGKGHQCSPQPETFLCAPHPHTSHTSPAGPHTSRLPRSRLPCAPHSPP